MPDVVVIESEADEAAEETAEVVADVVAAEVVADAVEDNMDTAIDLSHESRITALEIYVGQHDTAIAELQQIAIVTADAVAQTAELAEDALHTAVDAEISAEVATVIAEEPEDSEPVHHEEPPASKTHRWFKSFGGN